MTPPVDHLIQFNPCKDIHLSDSSAIQIVGFICRILTHALVSASVRPCHHICCSLSNWFTTLSFIYTHHVPSVPLHAGTGSTGQSLNFARFTFGSYHLLFVPVLYPSPQPQPNVFDWLGYLLTLTPMPSPHITLLPHTHTHPDFRSNWVRTPYVLIYFSIDVLTCIWWRSFSHKLYLARFRK